jgi:effector-binding domain-containing protein
VEGDVEQGDVLRWYAGAMAELDAVVDEPTGAPGGLYDNSLFEVGRGHVLVYRCTTQPPALGRVHPVEIPAVELAVATHVGDHGDIDVTYGEVGAWVATNALAVAGPIRETYLVGPRDTPDATAWRTEIGWPVFRVSSD